MGQETFISPVRIEKFLGLNQWTSDTSIHLWESGGLQNVDISIDALQQRNGSRKISDVFTDSTGGAKPITGLYQTNISGVTHNIGVGGDKLKELVASVWTDVTGAVTITNDGNNLTTFATFFDNGGNEVVIVSPYMDTPFKWNGGAAAAALAATPGNFKFPTVYMNKLWVVVNDILYWSALRDCETWNTAYDLQRFAGKGEDITGLATYANRLIVFKPSNIYMVSGSSYRDLAIDEVVTDDGTDSHYSIQEVESRRYGNILVFLSKEGVIKGFNGSKNLLLLGEPVKPLYASMNLQRKNKAVAANYKHLSQYWLSMSYGSNATNDQILVYDYANDHHTNEKTGKPLSSNLYHVGINANALASWEDSNNDEILVSGAYDGYLREQDYGLYDDETITIVSKWQTGKMDFGAPQNEKLLGDLSTVTTQSGSTTIAIAVTTSDNSGTATKTISADGAYLWGTMIWGTGLWSGPTTEYTRYYVTPLDGETAIQGRHFITQFNHSVAGESMRVEEMIFGAIDLGQQPEYIEV